MNGIQDVAAWQDLLVMKKNYAVSEKLANELLVHEVNALRENQLVIANGFSCRHQIDHFTHRSALHWVEALDFEL